MHALSTADALRLDGHRLTAEDVVRVARHAATVGLDAGALERMAAGRAVVERYLAEGLPAYGLTTGLGARVVEPLTADALAEFSLRTVRGRANSIGPPLPTDVVRAAILVRVNGLAHGGSGARPELAEALVALLNNGVHPVVPSIGSVGASDMCVLAHVALVLVGEGEAEVGGAVQPGGDALAAAGIEPLVLAPKDGLAAISSNAVSAGHAALAAADARAALALMQIAAALSMEGFRASLSPLDERVAAARPAPGQAEAAAELRSLLDGSTYAVGRRLQDPLSFRCVSQVHGSLAAALDFLDAALEPELNGAGDNPLVVAADGAIVSTGNFFVPALSLAADAVAIGLAQVANLSSARAARLLSAAITELPQNLAPPGSSGAGLAPLLKVTDALAAEIAHGAAPASLDARAGDSVEDASTGAPLGTARLGGLVERLRLLAAVELVIASRAVELAGPAKLGRGTEPAHALVRRLVAPLESDRVLGADVDRVAAALHELL